MNYNFTCTTCKKQFRATFISGEYYAINGMHTGEVEKLNGNGTPYTEKAWANWYADHK